MRLKGRQSLLILDNAAGHNVDTLNHKLTNVTIKFLEPNTTSHCQPIYA